MTQTRANILVVEDNADEAQTLQMILEQEGFQVARAANGQEGLEKLAASKPDLILLDVMMPELDGFGMCAKLREDPQYKDLPVVFLTGVAGRIRDTRYPLDGVLRADANEYLEKPVDPQALLATVARLL